jgi:serine/threonine protein kinase
MSPSLDLPWPRIPGYELQAELGRGAFGRVYRAFDPRFQRQVALKVVPVDSPEARVRIEREAQALARLSHPHVVQVYDKGPAGEHGYFLALEYVDGPDLHEWLAQQPRALPELLARFLQLAEGLAAAHRAGLVHRDLKPANVIVGFDGRVRVLDFGLARAADDASITLVGDEPRHRTHAVSHETRTDERPYDERPRCSGEHFTVAHALPGRPEAAPGDHEGCAPAEPLARPLTARGHFVGTPSYAAPEQHFGEADARSDQFSFCVALFEAVYGRRPLPLRRGIDPGLQLRTEVLDFRPSDRRVPRWLTSLLRQGLALDPRRRHASMETIVRVLRARLHIRPARMHAAWLAVGAAVLAACAMVLVKPSAGEAEACRHAPDAWAVDPSEAPVVSAWLSLAEGDAQLALGEPEHARARYREAHTRFAHAEPEVPPQLVALAELDEAIALSAGASPSTTAVPLAERALAIRRAAFAPNDPRIAHDTRALGEILVRTGDIDGALRRYAEADAMLLALGLPLERVFLRAELAHAHWLAARRARAQARQAELEGRDPAEPRADFERQRHLALRETLQLERLAKAELERAGGPPPITRAREQARVWAVAMASYGYHRGCWDRMLAASRRLERICEQLPGDEPSCVAGQRQRQGLLEQGAAARATDEDCVPHPDRY